MILPFGILPQFMIELSIFFHITSYTRTL